jgi:hypothetical protein
MTKKTPVQSWRGVKNVVKVLKLELSIYKFRILIMPVKKDNILTIRSEKLTIIFSCLVEIILFSKLYPLRVFFLRVETYS